ncbi:MAG: winged helix-turn-helix transcriptional regulator [Thermoplasmata archaeon]
MNGQKLRDLKRNTELLILVEILKSPSVRMREISGRLDITVQAVSQYISAMKKEGLLRESGGGLRPTRKGMQIAQEHFSAMKEYLDTMLRRISVIDRCVAIAGEDIKKDQQVGLLMEDGMLMAYPDRRSSSTGKAMESAREGDDVLIGQLEGIVDLELGKLFIIETPSDVDGGSKRANVERVRQKIEEFSPGLLVAGDLAGASLLSKSTEELFTIHAPVESAMSALSKGVDVVYCGTRDSTDRILEAVSGLKRDSGYEIKWKSLKA